MQMYIKTRGRKSLCDDKQDKQDKQKREMEKKFWSESPFLLYHSSSQDLPSAKLVLSQS